jgi:hypothetical protein
VWSQRRADSILLTRITTTGTNSDFKKTSFMKNYIDLPTSVLADGVFSCVFNLSNVAFRITASKFNCKFCLETPNKSKSETAEHFKLLGLKMFEKKEKVKRKIGSGKKCALSSSKVRAA